MDNISVVVIVLGAPAGTPAVVHASTRGTPVFATPNAAGLHEAMSGAVLTTPGRSAPVRAPHAAASQQTQSHIQEQQGRSHINRSRSQSQEEEDADSVDLPIFDVPRTSNTGSLNAVFAAVADHDDVAGSASPLNTAAGSGKVRKQLSFTNL